MATPFSGVSFKLLAAFRALVSEDTTALRVLCSLIFSASMTSLARRLLASVIERPPTTSYETRVVPEPEV